MIKWEHMDDNNRELTAYLYRNRYCPRVSCVGCAFEYTVRTACECIDVATHVYQEHIFETEFERVLIDVK